ncbi:hypothetical protein AAGS61_04905 [Lysinibacillus sp. KU-BSD001]|uniref:hypothetical protein n=1 Tax=Lysinibacillus sp. KU-BSD001 TaxID=3141328 RepID=UPI0036E5E432
MYMNQGQQEDQLKFPYMPITVAFHEDFEVAYQVLWKEASRRIAEYGHSDLDMFYKEKESFFGRLFASDAVGFKDFHTIYKTFTVWWDSLAGGFSVERSIDDRVEQVYRDLVNSLAQAGKLPQKPLHISVLYDDCLLGNEEHFSYFAIVPINGFVVQYKAVVLKLQGCME